MWSKDVGVSKDTESMLLCIRGADELGGGSLLSLWELAKAYFAACTMAQAWRGWLKEDSEFPCGKLEPQIRLKLT